MEVEDEDQAEEEAVVNSGLSNSGTTTIKQRKELQEIAAHNQPTQKSQLCDPEIGSMTVIKEDNRATIGEITVDLGETWKVHVFDTTTTKSLPRSRWKFYPRWRNTITDKVEVNKHQARNTTADVVIFPQEKVYVSFKKLHLNATKPNQVLDKISNLKIV